MINDERKTIRLLVLGPLPPPYTGTTSLLKYLVDDLEQEPSVELHVLNTLGLRGTGIKGIIRFVRLMVLMISKGIRCDLLTLHCSTTGLHVIGTAALMTAWLTNKPLIVRKFAGDDHRETLSRGAALLADTVLKHADLYLAETHALVRIAQQRGCRYVEWYPNSRPDSQLLRSQERRRGRRCTRFVFVGRVCEAKGMLVLAAAANELPPGLTIDVYGPWADDLEKDIFAGCPNVAYRGALDPSEIVRTFQQYDASILPTHYRGEGYPGAILESYIAGLPVIATRWQAIPEIVDDSVGILIEPRDSQDLARAMMTLADNPELFQRLCAGTREKAQFFTTQAWSRCFVNFCYQVLCRGR